MSGLLRALLRSPGSEEASAPSSDAISIVTPTDADMPPVEPGEAALALAQLERLKGYTLPGGRIPAIRELAQRMTGLTEPAEILKALHSFEAELIGRGGRFDPELAATISAVEQTFPDAHLADLRRRSS